MSVLSFDTAPPSLDIITRGAFDPATFEGVLLENYLQPILEPSVGQSCGYAVVTLVVPKKTQEYLLTIAEGGDVAYNLLVQNTGITTLENIFAWSRMWRDRRFLMTISQTLLVKRLLIRSCDITANTVEYLDPLHNQTIYADPTGGEFLRYVQNKKCTCGDAAGGGDGSDEDDGARDSKGGGTCTCDAEGGFIIPVDYAVKMLVLVDNDYMVFVRLTNSKSLSQQTINPFGDAGHNYEYHGSRMLYLDKEPLRFIPLRNF